MTLPLPAALFLFALAIAAEAQAPPHEDLKKRHEKALQEPFLKKAPWFLDYGKALAETKKTGKLIFGYFTRLNGVLLNQEAVHKKMKEGK